MKEENNVEKIYFESARKIKKSMPKFIIFLGLAYIVWLVGTTFFISSARGDFIGRIDITRLDSLIIISAVLLLLIASFIEVRNVCDASAGLVTSYIVHHKAKIEEIRFRQIRRSCRTIGYIVPVAVAFIIFSNFLARINPLINTVALVIFVIWIVIAALLFAWVVGLQIEETAKRFAVRISRIRIRKKKKK